ncbi:MAG: hypothetical protein KDI33_06615, partial [Halioglobus sp.]|nr:hypothetical protein [Halioglobus sp.]
LFNFTRNYAKLPFSRPAAERIASDDWMQNARRIDLPHTTETDNRPNGQIGPELMLAIGR